MPFVKKTHIYKTAECEIGCDVYLPRGEYPIFPEGQPVLIYCRMSGFVAFNRNAAGEHWWHSGTRRGYVVVNIDHRLAPQIKIDGIYQDIADCIAWVRTKLPQLIDTPINPQKVVMAGGSAGGHLSLLTGFLDEPPLAILSLYPLADPTAPGIAAKSSPQPPPGRKQLIEYSEVSVYMDENAGRVSSRGEVDDIDMHTCVSKGRGAALLFIGQEGLLYPSCYGTHDEEKIRSQWSVPHRIAEHAGSYPPCLLIHSKSDSFNSPDQSQMVADALKSRGWPHKLWLVEDYENDRGRPLEHGFDASDMGGQEVSGLEKNFAKLVWDDFLGPLVA